MRIYMMKIIEDLYWLEQAQEARKYGYLTSDESSKFLKFIIND